MFPHKEKRYHFVMIKRRLRVRIVPPVRHKGMDMQ